MTLNFNEWFIDLVSPGQTRTWDQRVNWVYYNDSGAQTPAQVDAAVNGYYASGTHFVDTVPTKSPANDHDGDGIGDISLLYDYGKGSATGCAQNGSARRTALFSLSGKADRSGGLGGITPLSDSPCETVSPKFVTSGDFNGDGRSDVAAFYDYGSTGSTCSPTNHVAIVEWLADPKGNGTLQSPKTVWESTCWGGGTAFLNSGDFNGDSKSDLALLYDYGAGHVSLLTLNANPNGSGGFGGLVPRWDGTRWGAGTKFMTTGDYNGDGKSDIALFKDYGASGATCAGNAHQAISTLTADPYGTGALHSPATAWESTCWGGGTAFMN